MFTSPVRDRTDAVRSMEISAVKSPGPSAALLSPRQRVSDSLATRGKTLAGLDAMSVMKLAGALAAAATK